MMAAYWCMIVPVTIFFALLTASMIADFHHARLLRIKLLSWAERFLLVFLGMLIMFMGIITLYGNKLFP